MSFSTLLCHSVSICYHNRTNCSIIECILFVLHLPLPLRLRLMWFSAISKCQLQRIAITISHFSYPLHNNTYSNHRTWSIKGYHVIVYFTVKKKYTLHTLNVEGSSLTRCCVCVGLIWWIVGSVLVLDRGRQCYHCWISLEWAYNMIVWLLRAMPVHMMSWTHLMRRWQLFSMLVTMSSRRMW